MHVLNRVLATLLALALFLGGLLAVIEIVLAALDRPALIVPHRQWSEWLTGQSFDGSVVRAALVALVVIGLLLLVVGLHRGKPGSIPLPGRTDGVHVTASRRGLQRSLATTARRAEGVRSAQAKVGRRTVKVKATTAVRSGSDLRQPITAGITERLEELNLSGVLRPRVTVSQEKSR